MSEGCRNPQKVGQGIVGLFPEILLLAACRADLAVTRNQVYGEPYRGFESLPLRQQIIEVAKSSGMS